GQVGIPPALEDIGIDHLGDPDYYAGYVFVPLEGVQYVYVPPEGVLAGWWKRIRIAGIAAFRASDLAFVDWVNVSAFQPKAGWVAIDPVEHMLYTSDDHIVAGTPLLRYAVDVSKIENGIPGDFLTPMPPIAVLEADGSPVSGQFTYMQGGVFTPWGDLYLSVGTQEDSAAATRGGIHLFRRTADGSAFRLVESSVNISAPVGAPVFAYEYHPDSGE